MLPLSLLNLGHVVRVTGKVRGRAAIAQNGLNGGSMRFWNTGAKQMRRKWHFALCFLWLATGAVTARADCVPLPGAEQVWSRPALRWLFVGELHGSNEAPAAFLDLVCDALAHGRRVTVALERPTSERAVLNGILVEKDLAAAKQTLLAEPDWKNGMDGRASEAMLRLLLALRDLRLSYPDLAIAAFDAPYSGSSPGARDEAMGRALLVLGKAEPRDLILILTGNVHGMQSPQFGYDFAAMFIPPEERLSLEVTDRGGQSWSESSKDACGGWDGTVGDKGAKRPRGIYLDPVLAPYGKVDGVLSLGVPLSASAPAAGDPSPLPACRVKFLQQSH
jgi:hypothetical protein